MQFRNQITYNAHDSSIEHRSDGRIVVSLGLRQRCELIIHALLRRKKNGATIADLLCALRRKSESYTLSDVRGALKRISLFYYTHGNTRNTRYFPTPSALETWNMLQKRVKMRK